MDKSLQRDSSFELMRIMAMCMIVGLHYFGGVYYQMQSLDRFAANSVFYELAESACICGVNLFVLITGYFSVSAQNISFAKILKLMLDVMFWGTVGYLLAWLFHEHSLNFVEWTKIIMPYFWKNRWFVEAYIILLLLIPFLNKCLNSISRHSHEFLLLVSLSVLSVWPTFLPNPPIDDYGYSFVHFVLIFMIASYIRKYLPKDWGGQYMLLYVLFTLLISITSIFNVIGNTRGYNNLFVILQSVSIFMFFRTVSVKPSKIINKLASCAFGIFLIHTDLFFSRLVYDEWFQRNFFATRQVWLFFANFVLCILFFYAFGFILESVRKLLSGTFEDKIIMKVLGKKAKISIN